MRLSPTLERLWPRPFDAAVARLTLTLTIDSVVLRRLRRAARDEGPLARATYAWALGAAPDELVDLNRAAHQYALAADELPDDAAVQYGFGLVHAGGLGRRRSMPLDARRGFAAAARLEPGNMLPHLALAAARYSTGDSPTAAQCIDDALPAGTCRFFFSPVGERIDRAAPWLGYSLSRLWPYRSASAVRYTLSSLAHEVWRARRREQDPEAAAGRLDRVARRMLAVVPERPAEFLLATGAVMLSLATRHKVLGDAAALETRRRVGQVVADLLRERREVDRQFETSARRLLAGAGGGVAIGLVTALYGLARSRRRWPPPIPLVLPGRVIAYLGTCVAAASVAGVVVPNPATAARRRAIERRLVAAESSLVTTARERIEDALA